jgi:DMSO reductase anchor subunit
MPPAPSVIAFTVLSGAGLGALALIALGDLGAAYAGWPALAPRPMLAVAAGAGLALVLAGLGASTLLLANPRNAWRSSTRFGASWLSRGAVFALLLVPVATVFIASLALDARPRRMWGWTAATLLLAWTMLARTATIDASLEPIRYRPIARASLAPLVLGHASGAVIVEAFVRSAAGATWVASAGVALLVAWWLVSEEDWRHARSGEGAPTIGEAVGGAHGVRPPGAQRPGSAMAVRVLGAGHSRRTFPTRESDDSDRGTRRTRVRRLVFVASIVVPGVWLVAGLADPLAGAVVTVSCLAGLAAERWQLFADVRQPVRQRHGDRSA